MAEIAPLRAGRPGPGGGRLPAAPRVRARRSSSGLPLVSVWHMGAYDVFDFAFRKGERPARPQGDSPARRSCSAAPAGRSIVRPMLSQAGVDPASVSYAEAGNGWGQALKDGQGDAALSWEGLRAQWQGQGLEFDYILRPRVLEVSGQQLRDPARRLRRIPPRTRCTRPICAAGRWAWSSATSIRARRRISCSSSFRRSPRR